MPRYVSLGNIPRKRHTQFRKPDGSLYAEQVFGTRGFSGIASILHHVHPRGVELDDLFIDRDGFQREAGGLEGRSGLEEGLDRLGLGVFFEVQIADRVIRVPVVGRLGDEGFPRLDGFVDLSFGGQTLGVEDDRVFI